MFKTCVAEEYQLKQAKIEVLQEENTVLLQVLPVKRESPAAKVRVKTTAEWDALADKVLKKGVLIAYSDYAGRLDEEGNEIAVPGMKVGDGVTPIGQLGFLVDNSIRDVMTEPEAREVLGMDYPVPDGPEGTGILTEKEIESILNESYEDDEGESSVAPDCAAEESPGSILSEDEVLRILSQGSEDAQGEEGEGDGE